MIALARWQDLRSSLQNIGTCSGIVVTSQYKLSLKQLKIRGLDVSCLALAKQGVEKLNIAIRCALACCAVKIVLSTRVGVKRVWMVG